MIIVVLTLSLISAVSAVDVDEAVNTDNSEIQIPEVGENQIYEFVEVNQLDFEEFEIDDIVENDVISEDEFTPINYNQEYNDSYIITDTKNLNEIENHQYNNTYIESLINETLSNNTNLDLNNSIIVSFNFIYNDFFFKEHEIFIYMNIDSSHKTLDFASNLSKHDDIDKFKILTHEDLIFYNFYCNFLTHDVDKNIFISNDKLHSKFVFSIDNSIVDSTGSFIYYILNPNFSNIFLVSLPYFQTFSNFVQIFIDINYYELAFSE